MEAQLQFVSDALMTFAYAFKVSMLKCVQILVYSNVYISDVSFYKTLFETMCNYEYNYHC